MTERLGFLSYAARSGSTKFAYELQAAVPELVVVPETRVVEGLFQRATEPSAVEIQKWVESDMQLPGYTQLSTGEIGEQILAGFSDGGRQGALRAVAAVAVGQAPEDLLDRYLLFKWSSAVFYWPLTVSNSYGKADLFVVHRHPCATTNSLLRTERAYFPGEDMGRSDVWHCAQLWARHAEATLSLGDVPIKISYESVLDGSGVAHARRVVSDGLSPSAAPSTVTSFRIAEGESSMHRLLMKDGDSARVEAWRTELDQRSQRIVGSLCRNEAEALGYTLPGFASTIEIAIGYANHIAKTLQHFGRRARQFRGRPGVVARHLRSRVRERVGSRSAHDKLSSGRKRHDRTDV